jgi:16S rRNA (cytosine967-C5)-methyltransferase
VKPSAARLCAYRTLRRVTAGGAFADRALRGEAERAGLDARDLAFAQRLAYGAVQRLGTVDHVLRELSSRPLGEVDDPLLDALRLGVVQVVWLDSVPDRAAVEQTVELAKLEHPAGAGFANAVMRRAAREARGLVAALDDDTPEAAAVAHSHPEWIARLWWDALGPDEARALMRRDNETAESAVRANELRTTRDQLAAALAERGVPARPVRDLPEGLVLEASFDAHASDLFEDGLLMPQSRGSMRVSRLVDPKPGERVLDLCAAPGSKTTHLAALMRGEGELVAVDRNEARARALAANCQRMGVAAKVVTADARNAPVGGDFDRVLLDAPCSDLGTLQSRPDARWRKSPAQVEELAALQDELLDPAADRVRAGGALVFSTCTISPAENELAVERFLAGHGDFELEETVRLLPHRDLTDGFYVARLRKR